MTDKLVPALIGGLILGVLCAIFVVIPVPLVGLCCCVWAIGGGVLAVMIYVKKSPTRVSVGDGSMIGAMTGVIGGVIYFVLANTIFGLIIGVAKFESQFKATGVEMPMSGFALILIFTLLTAIFLGALAVGGGALGIPIFEKRKDGDAPPPPPPPFGGAPGGGSNFGASV